MARLSAEGRSNGDGAASGGIASHAGGSSEEPPHALEPEAAGGALPEAAGGALPEAEALAAVAGALGRMGELGAQMQVLLQPVVTSILEVGSGSGQSTAKENATNWLKLLGFTNCLPCHRESSPWLC